MNSPKLSFILIFLLSNSVGISAVAEESLHQCSVISIAQKLYSDPDAIKSSLVQMGLTPAEAEKQMSLIDESEMPEVSAELSKLDPAHLKIVDGKLVAMIDQAGAEERRTLIKLFGSNHISILGPRGPEALGRRLSVSDFGYVYCLGTDCKSVVKIFMGSNATEEAEKEITNQALLEKAGVPTAKIEAGSADKTYLVKKTISGP